MSIKMAVFLYYFAPISAAMFIFGLVYAIKYAFQDNGGHVIFYGAVSVIGFLMSLGSICVFLK